MRQPLLWNPLFTYEVARVLGLRRRLSWVVMDSGPTCTVADWLKFLQTSPQDQRNMLSDLRGAKIMFSQLSTVYQVTVPTLQFDHFQSCMFSTLNILIGAHISSKWQPLFFMKFWIMVA